MRPPLDGAEKKAYNRGAQIGRRMVSDGSSGSAPGDESTARAGASGDGSAPDDARADGGEALDPDNLDHYDSGGTPAGEMGAPDDQEMPLTEHVEEMVRRLGVVVVVMAVVSGLVFPFADRLINFLWYSYLPGSPAVCPTTGNPEAACPRLYHPLALMFARLKVASLVGFVAALPVTVYQSYLFMRPGLYPRERRYYLASVPTSLILAGVGIFFAYLLVLPALFVYFTGYTSQAAEVAFGLSETFNLIVMMMGFFALVFQIPLLIMLAIMMGVTSRRWLADRRIYFWGGFATVAFLFSPDPTGMAPILVAATMILLFEGTLLLLYWTGEATTLPTADALAVRRPFAWVGAGLVGYLLSAAPLPGSYYGAIPDSITALLVQFELAASTPLLVGGALIALYEGALYFARQIPETPGAARAAARYRLLVWPAALLVGYFGSPDPVLLQRVDAVDLATVEAAAAALGIVVAFELAVIALRWREGGDEAAAE